ncbi:MAG: ferrous iron transporter B, partial [Firmicutes bacterium]|nr:ferrous iron transporter B [Bacillota bacterium]
IDGIWNTLSWIVAVMLPPMAIFFPLFTFLEDVGYLPRLAFNLDRCFQCCGSCGKQALPMCMGFGCNAAGVVGCRIIQSPRERILAILTNSFVPCNGRFPLLAAMAAMLCVGRSGWASILVLGCILLGIGATFGATKLLSVTLLRGVPSSFVLELPPYRLPKLSHILVRSLLDRTLFVLGRAVTAAIPAGVFIWILSNFQIAGVTLLSYCTGILDPLGHLMGVDGTILMGFLLGMPANEIVMPIILMGYMGSQVMAETGTAVMTQVLFSQGWTGLTMINVMILCLFHSPCITTLMSIRKETGSRKWTLIAAALPTVLGMVLCILTTAVTRI